MHTWEMMGLDHKKYNEANRAAWNEATLIHQKARKINLQEKFKEKGFSVLDPIETEKLQEFGLEGKKVAQLCCNNGRELLSILNLGAKSGIGFDISDEAIKEANRLQTVSGLDCTFNRTNVYDIDAQYDHSVDLVYISAGALTWLRDLERFFQIVSDMLTPDGQVMIYEIHPFTDMLETEDDWDSTRKQKTDSPLTIGYSYFKTDPWIENTGMDYIGKTTYESKTNYSFTQRLSTILNAIIRSGIAINELTEYAHDISSSFAHIEKEQKVPLSYILIGRKY